MPFTKDDVRGFDVAVEQAVPVQEAQSRCDRRPQADTFGDRQPPQPVFVLFQGSRRIGRRKDCRAGDDVIGQFHHAVEVSGGLIASNLQNIHQPVVQPGDGLKLQNAVELALKGPPVLDHLFHHDFDRTVGAERILGQARPARCCHSR